jgi:hypothetical protein
MKYKVDDKYTLDSDRYNWVLIETITPKTKKPYTKQNYYGTLKQLSEALLDGMAKETLTRLSITTSENAPTIKPYNLLMDNIVKDLELFLQGVLKNEKA